MNEQISSERVFLLYIETEGGATYGFDAFDEMDYWEDFVQKYFDGRLLPSDWVLPRHEIGCANLPFRDFVRGYSQAPFVSARARDALLPIVGAGVQFFGIGRLGGSEYFVMNVVQVVDCLDVEHSQISISPSDPSRILAVDSAVFDPMKTPDLAVFKVPQDLGRVFVTLPFVECVRRHRLTGVGFERPDKIGLTKIHKVFDDLPFS